MKTNSNTNKVIASIATVVALLSCTSAYAESSDSQIADLVYAKATKCNMSLSLLLRRDTSDDERSKAAMWLKEAKGPFEQEVAQLAQSDGQLRSLSAEKAETVAVCLSNLRSLVS